MDTTVKIPDTPELRFDEKSHIYRLDGAEIPSVSKLMEPLKDKCYAGISEKTLAKAADKGSSVHNSIENWLKFGIDDIPEEHRPYFDGFLEWWKEYQPDAIASEVKTYHKLMRYGGTIDLLAFINGELTLVDFKTTYKIHELNCRVQLEAYSQALKTHGIQVERKHILHLEKNGRWGFPEYPARDPDALLGVNALKWLYDHKE